MREKSGAAHLKKETPANTSVHIPLKIHVLFRNRFPSLRKYAQFLQFLQSIPYPPMCHPPKFFDLPQCHIASHFHKFTGGHFQIRKNDLYFFFHQYFLQNILK